MTYDQLLRSLVRDQGEPAHFDANRVRLTNADLATALRRYDDILPEAAVDVMESIAACLDGNSSFAGMFRSKEEAIGFALVNACRHRLTPLVKLDLKCMASDMELEDRTDDEHEHGSVHA